MLSGPFRIGIATSQRVAPTGAFVVCALGAYMRHDGNE